jgi:GTPase SAR1 family protein
MAFYLWIKRRMILPIHIMKMVTLALTLYSNKKNSKFQKNSSCNKEVRRLFKMIVQYLIKKLNKLKHNKWVKALSWIIKTKEC